MKTNEALMHEYGANEDQLADAFDNALVSMQDKYGYAVVTTEFLGANDEEFSELVEASLEAYKA